MSSHSRAFQRVSNNLVMFYSSFVKQSTTHELTTDGLEVPGEEPPPGRQVAVEAAVLPAVLVAMVTVLLVTLPAPPGHVVAVVTRRGGAALHPLAVDQHPLRRRRRHARAGGRLDLSGRWVMVM